MSSERKIAANRRNAQKSTGPRTLSGKAIACMNALKHGLCSRQPLIPGEDPAEFARFAADLVDHFRPSDPVRAIQVEQYIVTAWQLRRVPQIRAAMITEQMQWEAKRKEPIHPFRMDNDGFVNLARIDRHQQTLERTMNKALRELETADSADEEDLQNEPTKEPTMEEGPRIEELAAAPRIDPSVPEANSPPPRAA